jgi:putative phosphoribosyl transferase
MFTDRMDAGAFLATKLLHLKGKDPVVFALARGGVPVGFEVAVALNAPLDVVLVRKIGAPNRPELAIGAVADGPQPEIVLNQSIVDTLRVPTQYIDRTAQRELAEIARRRALYFGGRPPIDAKGKTAIVVDDGIATGATMRAALISLRRRQPARLVLAVPVATIDTIEELRPEADEVVCMHQPHHMYGVGAFYDDFQQVGDEEVVDLLDRAASQRRALEASHERR